MPQQVDFKGLGIIEYPDDWTEEQIREDARVNEAEITRKIQDALIQQAEFETSEDPENQPEGFLEHLGDAAMGVAQSAVRTVAAVPKMMGNAFETLPPEAFVGDPMGRVYVPPPPTLLTPQSTESTDTRKKRIESNELVKIGEAIEGFAKEQFPTLPGADKRFWTGQVPQGLGTTVAGVATSLVGGPVAGFATMFSAEAQDAWDEELQRQTEDGEEYNPDKALLKAFGYGAFAGAVENRLGVGRLTRKLQEAFKGTPREAVERASAAGVLGKFLAGTAKEAAAGFTEEGIQKIGQGLIVHGTPDIDAAIQEGLVGAVVQSGLSIPANAMNAMPQRRQTRLASTESAVRDMEEDAGIIPPPDAMTLVEADEIEGVSKAVAKANKPSEKPAPLPVAEPGSAKRPPFPEAESAIIEQIRLTADPQSTKAATLITPENKVPDFDDDLLMTVKTKHGTVIFNPDKIGPDEIAEAAKGDVFDGTVLGMADSGKKPIESAIVVTTSTPAARNVITELVDPTEEAIKAATEAQQAAVPGGKTEVKPAADIIKERQEDGLDPEGAGAAVAGAGRGAIMSLYDALWEQASKGSVRIAGFEDPVLVKVKPLVEAGQVQSPEDLRAWSQDGQKPDWKNPRISEAAQPATPQAETPPGVVAPGPGGVVAPLGSSETLDEGNDQSSVGTPGTGEERIPEGPVQGDQGGSAAEPVRIKVGDMLESGQVGLTKTGRKTTPFPKVNVKTNAGATKTVKAVDRWLMENALAEAISRGDEFNQRQFHAAAKNPQQADKDSAEEYLFGDSPPFTVPKPALKPLVEKGGEESGLQGKEEGQKEDVLKPEQLAGNATPPAKPSKKPTPKPAPGIKEDAPEVAKAKEDLESALTDLADLFGTKLNIIPEQKQKVFPILVKAFDAAFRLGYFKFRDAARYILKLLRDRGAGNIADSLTDKDLQGAYIAMSSAVGDKADSASDVISITKEAIEKEENDQDSTELPGKLEGEQPAAGPGVGEGGGTQEETGGSGDQPAGGASDSGTRSDDAPEPVGDSGGVRSPPVPSPGNYRITDEDAIGAGGLKSKFKANIEAVRVLKQIEAENREATAEEQAVLVKFTGWGAMGGAFGEVEGWAKEAQQLKEILTEEEYATARRSTLDAFYTSPTVVRGIHGILTRLGFRGGKMVEGGVGVGHFIGLMPQEWIGKTSYVGVERDSLTARIASKLYPKARIIESPFEKANLSRDTYDASMGNPPFGQQKLFDPNFKEESSFSIHNYFIAKQIALLRPGGVGAWVVSHRFLDKLDPQARAWIAKHADFLGAIRLPSNAFKSNAGTEVTTDIVVFRRRNAEEPQGGVTGWERTGTIQDEKTGKPIKLNAYFVENPEMMIGIPSLAGKLYSGPSEEGQFTLEPKPGVDLAEAITKATQRFPEDIYGQEIKAETERLEHFDDTAVPKDVPVGSFFVAKDGKIMVRTRDENGLRTSQPLATRYKNDPDIVRGLIEIRDTLRKLSALERDASSDPKEIERVRAALNNQYDDFIKKRGILNRIGNRRVFNDDPLSPRVFALEREIDPGISKTKAKEEGIPERKPTASKADIFSKRVSFPVQEITSASDAKSGLAVSLNQRGNVDINYIAALTNLTPEKVISDLEGVIYLTPEGAWQTAVDYLSGDVREKLKQAKAAAELDTRFTSNIAALEKVIPKDIPASEIRVPFGAPWVGENIISDFITKLTGFTPDVVFYAKAIGKWTVSIKAKSNADKTVFSVRWGTRHLSFEDIVNKLLAGQRIAVYEEGPDGKRTLNEQETSAANQKAEEILQAWDNWLMRDEVRRNTLVRAYNDLYNSYVQPQFDGSHLTLPGKTSAIQLLKHQLRGAWRIITQRNVLLDHVVGAGKTFVGISAFMEMRRLGIARKPIFAVPNHLTTQWRDEWIKLYPNANILWAAPSDFQKKNRHKLFARIANGDWDAVIVGHSSLIHLGMPAESEAAIFEEMIAELVEAIREAKLATGGKEDARFVKDLERRKESLETKLVEVSARIGKRERTMTFDELGIDGLFLDEAHEFKNLSYNTAMRPAPSGLGNPKGADKSFDLLVKLHFLRKQFSGQAPTVFATGTPISNSLLEVFHVMRYLMPQRIKDLGINTADAFMRTFGDIGSTEGVDASGTRFAISTAFKGFINGGELAAMYRSFADTVTTNNLHDQYQAEKGQRFPTPLVKGGKPKVMVVKRSDEQAAFFGEEDDNGNYPPNSILWRIDNLPDDPSIDNMLAITSDARKAGLDMRIVNPTSPDHPGSKVNRCVAEVLRIYKENDYRKGTQLVFCDLSAPKSAKKAAAPKAPAESDVFWMSVGDRGSGKMELVPETDSPKPFTWEGAPEGYSFFTRKTRQKNIAVTERSTGMAVVIAGSLKEAKEKLARIFAQPGSAENLKRLIEENKRSDAEIAEFLAANGKAEEVEGTDEGDLAEEASDEIDFDQALALSSLNFSVYDDVKAKLIAQGIPEDQIAFIHDFDKPAKKIDLFNRMNAGVVRVLMGSTPKLGAGTNVQKRLVALHHLDAPWRPSDLEQREGRIIRQGNEFYDPQNPNAFQVEINRYATELTYDARMWQIIERKATGIEAFRLADPTTRELGEVAGEAASASEMKAAASGNPLILEEIQLRTAIKKAELRARAAKQQLWDLEAQIKEGDGVDQSFAESQRERADKIEKLAKDNPADPFKFVLPGQVVTDAEKAKALLFEAAKKIVPGTKGYTKIFEAGYRGVHLEWEYSMSTTYDDGNSRPFLHLYTVLPGTTSQTKMGDSWDITKEKPSFSGMLTRVDNFLKNQPKFLRESADEGEKNGKKKAENARKAIEEMPKVETDVSKLKERYAEVVNILRAEQEKRKNRNKSKLDKAIDKTADDIKRLKEGEGEGGIRYSGAPAWLTPQILNWLLRAVRALYLKGVSFRDAIRKAASDAKAEKFEGFDETEAVAWMDANVIEDKTKTRGASILLKAEPAAPAEARGSQAQEPKPKKRNEPTQSLPTSDTGQPIQPGGRRGESMSEFGATYVRQKERERELFAKEFIRQKGSLTDALGAVAGITDESFFSVTLGEIIAQAAEVIQGEAGKVSDDQLEAIRIVERGTKLLQQFKADTAQALQAQNQINERLGPFKAILSYLELIRGQQKRILGKKFPTVVSDNIRAWMKTSARQAIEALARSLKNPDTLVTRLLRQTAGAEKINWNALFQVDWNTQKEAQRKLFANIRSHPDLAVLSKPEAVELTNYLMAAWTKEHGKIFRAEFERHVNKGASIPKSDMQRLVRSLPRIVRWLNLGILDDERFRQAVAPEFGIGALDDAEVIELSSLAQQAQKLPEGLRRNKVYQQMVDVIVASQGIKTTDLLKDFWFANVLSGLRTWIDVGVGSWLSAFTMTARAAADLTIRGKPRMAYRVAANLIRASVEGVANAADIIASGDVSRLPDAQARLWKILSGKASPDTLEAAKRRGKGWQKLAGQLSFVRRIMIGLDYVGALGARDAMLLYAALSRDDHESIAAAMRRFDKAETDRALAQAKAELGPDSKWVDVKARQRELLEEGVDEEIRESATTLGKVAALNADPVGFGGIMYRVIAMLPWAVRAPLGLSFARAAINMAQNASDWMPGIGLVNWARAKAIQTKEYQALPLNHPFRKFGLDVPVERRRLILGAQVGGFALTAIAMGIFLDDDDDNRDLDINGTWHGLTPQQRGQLMNQGEKPLSIRVGNTWVSYKNTPFAAALAFVGNVRERQRFKGEQFNAESAAERLVNAYLMGALYIRDVSALSQFAEVIGSSAFSTKDEVEGFNRKFAATIGNTLAGFVPGASMLREIDTITDPAIYRPTNGMEAWIRNIPFARRAVGYGPAVDALGGDIAAPRVPWGRWISAKSDDPEWETLAKLSMNGVFVPVPSKTATIMDRKGSRRQMLPEEYWKYQQEAGKRWRAEIRSGRGFLRSAKPAEAAKWFKDRTEEIHKAARGAVRPVE